MLTSFAASVQDLETNVMQSLNDILTGGYVFNFADLTPEEDDAESINCTADFLNLQGTTGATGAIVSVDGGFDPQERLISYQLLVQEAEILIYNL